MTWLQRKYSIAGAMLTVMFFVTGCGASAGADGGKLESNTSGEQVSVGETDAIVWGKGDKGTVLAHGAAYDAASWEEQGQELAENGVVALAVEDTSPENLRSAVDYLEKEYGVESVTFVGASAGAGSVLEAAEEYPEEIDQMILLSGGGTSPVLGSTRSSLWPAKGRG
jgi:pimeloyl-ACP methyl ester carboxylesterase